jgi:hypothetical protein
MRRLESIQCSLDYHSQCTEETTCDCYCHRWWFSTLRVLFVPVRALLRIRRTYRKDCQR